MQRKILSELNNLSSRNLKCLSNLNPNLRLLSTLLDDTTYSDVPKPEKNKSKRKPYVTPMKVLIKRAKEEREVRKAQPCRLLEHPPDNGLLVPELVEVAHRVYFARESLLLGLSKLVRLFPVKRCRFCFEVHIGNSGHEIRTCTGTMSGFRRALHVWRRGQVQDLIHFPHCFHLYDRVGKPRVGHDERSRVKRIPAIIELCIQAGLDLEKYPTRRRANPVYSIEGRIVDFEPESEKDEKIGNKNMQDCVTVENLDAKKHQENRISDIENLIDLVEKSNDDEGQYVRELSIKTLDSWFHMISGAKQIMEKYTVWTCGYCPEVQVGPKGHKVRMCKAAKHQSRNGLHAWQEATIDDIVGPNYVWHVQDLHGPPLDNNLKRFYGKAPSVVELCVQAGAPVPDQNRSMMRLDVVPPDRDEVDLVA